MFVLYPTAHLLISLRLLGPTCMYVHRNELSQRWLESQNWECNESCRLEQIISFLSRRILQQYWNLSFTSANETWHTHLLKGVCRLLLCSSLSNIALMNIFKSQADDLFIFWSAVSFITNNSISFPYLYSCKYVFTNSRHLLFILLRVSAEVILPFSYFKSLINYINQYPVAKRIIPLINTILHIKTADLIKFESVSF